MTNQSRNTARGLWGAVLAAALAAPAWAQVAPVGQEFPSFDIKNTYKLPTVKKLSELRGKAVIIDVWATWCPPCRAAIAHFVDLYAKSQKDGLEIISISTDDSAADWKAFIPTHKMTWINMHDPQLGGRFVINNGIPSLYVLDRQGKVLFCEAGFSQENIDKAVEQALKSAGGPAATADPNSPELAAADKLRDEKKYADAYDAYEAIIRTHKTDDVGKAAKLHLDEMKKLPAVQDLVKQREAAANIDRWLKFARQQRDTKQYEMARKYYQKIIDTYPGTDGAKTAAEELKALPAK